MLDAAPPILYPVIPMAKYGLNPHGANMYRLIWAPSRRIVVHNHITNAPKTIQCYMPPFRPIGEYWVIESWKSCFEYAGAVTEDQWNANPSLNCMGPYPRQGVYEHRETLSCDPSQASIDKLITWLEQSHPRENAAFVEKQLDDDLNDRKSKRDALTRSSMRPWGAESYAAAGGGRNSKTYPIVKSREELGLPDQGVTKAMRVKKPATYEIVTTP